MVNTNLIEFESTQMKWNIAVLNLKQTDKNESRKQ